MTTSRANQIFYKRTKRSAIKRGIATVIYGLMLLLLYFVICLQVFAPMLSIRLFGFQTYIISYTGSMEPMLTLGDLIVVQKYDFDKLKKNDIITFLGQTQDGEQIVITHEIVDIAEIDGIKMLQTKGKANDLPDYIPVTEHGENNTNTYIGKYAFKSTAIGNLITYLKAPQGMLTLTINLTAILLILLLKTPQDPKLRLT